MKGIILQTELPVYKKITKYVDKKINENKDIKTINPPEGWVGEIVHKDTISLCDFINYALAYVEEGLTEEEYLDLFYKYDIIEDDNATFYYNGFCINVFKNEYFD